MASCIAGARAFLLPSVPMTQSALRPNARCTVPVTAGERRQELGSSSGQALFLFGGLLVAAAIRRSRRGVSRSVTREQLETLTVADLPTNWRPPNGPKAQRVLQIQAITRQLDKTFFLMAFNRENMLGSQVEEAKSFFPPNVNVRVLRNTWVRKAMEGTDWEPLAPQLKGSNVYVFVESDKDLKPSIQAYLKLEKEFDRTGAIDAIKEANDDMTYEIKPLVGGMMSEEWNVLQPQEIIKLKDFPTKTELIGQIAGSIKQVTTKLAVGIRQVPTKLAIGIKKTVEKGEEGGKGTVGDVTPE
mmetsp:Transcript_28486/g.50588  ORF Transcript_28486/g.50588 Transcript_28486/m.50588 type:complete len:300 (+) Transcript_28486:1-900(+)